MKKTFLRWEAVEGNPWVHWVAYCGDADVVRARRMSEQESIEACDPSRVWQATPTMPIPIQPHHPSLQALMESAEALFAAWVERAGLCRKEPA